VQKTKREKPEQNTDRRI